MNSSGNSLPPASGTQPKLALALNGGGARGAYQAGVLAELSSWREFSEKLPFTIYSGISVGAINTSFLAAHHADRQAGLQLAELWSELVMDKVINTNLSSIASIGGGLFKNLLLGSGHATHLMDASPLAGLLQEKISFRAIRSAIKKGDLDAVAMTATNYSTGQAETFFQSHDSLPGWTRSSRKGVPTEIHIKQLFASAAIPMLFAPVQLADGMYGDGGIRMETPLSPAIHLNADKIFTIGLRGPSTHTATAQESVNATLADIFGVILNAMFLDALPSNLENLEYMNELARTASSAHLDLISKERRLRALPVLAVFPSESLGELARDEFKNFPFVLRHLLSGLGASEERGADLMSYLAFSREYTGRLVALGRKDALAKKAEIVEFLTT